MTKPHGPSSKVVQGLLPTTMNNGDTQNQ